MSTYTAPISDSTTSLSTCSESAENAVLEKKQHSAASLAVGFSYGAIGLMLCTARLAVGPSHLWCLHSLEAKGEPRQHSLLCCPHCLCLRACPARRCCGSAVSLSRACFRAAAALLGCAMAALKSIRQPVLPLLYKGCGGLGESLGRTGCGGCDMGALAN